MEIIPVSEEDITKNLLKQISWRPNPRKWFFGCVMVFKVGLSNREINNGHLSLANFFFFNLGMKFSVKRKRNREYGH